VKSEEIVRKMVNLGGLGCRWRVSKKERFFNFNTNDDDDNIYETQSIKLDNYKSTAQSQNMQRMGKKNRCKSFANK
jgi:hypothetical protein